MNKISKELTTEINELVQKFVGKKINEISEIVSIAVETLNNIKIDAKNNIQESISNFDLNKDDAFNKIKNETKIIVQSMELFDKKTMNIICVTLDNPKFMKKYNK